MLLLRIIFSLSWTHPQQLPTPNKYLWTGHEILESSPSKLRKGSLQQVRCPSERSAASMRVEYLIAVLESIQPTWWWPTHFFGEILPFSSEMIKIYVSKTTWSTTLIFGSVSSFLTGHWPHLLMFLNVLDGFFHKFEPGLGLSPALKDVENRLNVNRGFPERPVTPQHSNTPNLSKG